MNKKILMFGIPLLAIAIVSALVVLSFSVTVNTSQSVFVDGEPQAIPCLGGETCIGEPVVITNNANVNAELKLVNDADCEDVEISYVGKLDLTKKDTTTWAATGNAIEIIYTVVGENFEYDDSNLPEGYILVYAMDKENRFSEYATVIKVEDIDEGLPTLGDWNADADPDYCNLNNGFDSYNHCVGAKLWAINEDDLGTETEGVYELAWTDMVNYYYETDLIYYFANAEDNIIVPAGSNLVIYPSISVATLAGDETCEFTVGIESQ